MQLKIRSHELREYAKVNAYLRGIEDTCEIECVPILLDATAKTANHPKAIGLNEKALQVLVVFLHHPVPVSEAKVPEVVAQLLVHPKATKPNNEDEPCLNDSRSFLVDFPPLVEQLSERECDVLRLLAEGMTNEEIAEVLTVATGTVKAHNNHIFGKLGVTNRTQAVARARALQLL